jgi:cytoskeletal protein CcmA (bactofilin family)
MFGKEKMPPLKSLIASGTRVQGDVWFEDGLRIDGEVVGNIMGGQDKPTVLVVGESAKISGDISAAHVIVNGHVDGLVTAHRLLELQPKAEVVGDVNYKAIELHLGAMVTGRLCPIPDAGEEKPPLTLAASQG